MTASEPAIERRSAASLTGVGPRIGEKLERLGVRSVGDLLCLLPHRYEDRTEIRPLGSLRPGERVLVEGEVALAEVAFRRRRNLLCRIADGTGSITLRFFHFSRAQQAQFTRGSRVRCFGEVRAGPTGLEMVHPEYRMSTGDEAPLDTLTPIYPATEGLQQGRLRRLVDQALAMLESSPLTDYLSDQLQTTWPSLDTAVKTLHRPPRGTDLSELAFGRHPSLRRVALEELIAHRLSMRLSAQSAKRVRAAPIEIDSEVQDVFRRGLPFELTPAQDAAVSEILDDLARPVPMHRLLQGDVGSGKTVVAALAIAIVARAGYQAAFMAPTEILAEQHADKLAQWLNPLGLDVVLLTGSQSAAERKRALGELAGGSAEVVVGTHALYQDAVDFKRLGMVVVDEQHRFGVDQRLRLMEKGAESDFAPHQLIMTATPIPRTLAMTVYADLDCSVIDSPPAGRRPVQTVVMAESRRADLVQRVGRHCVDGAQAYWVCPLISESDLIETSAAEELVVSLREVLPELRLGLIHGRMKGVEKDRVMRSFKRGDVDLLVATTVIEVGVDVPSATLMIIENAERMGLAQLHQLRGRVGRGHEQSHCVLLYKPPLSEVARARLNLMRETTDGFAIAQKDLELRGPGEVLGTRQTGVQDLRVADLARDADLLSTVVEISDRIERDYPERVDPLIRRWIKTGMEYAKV